MTGALLPVAAVDPGTESGCRRRTAFPPRTDLRPVAGELGGIDGVRAAVARTADIRTWYPRADARWERAAAAAAGQSSGRRPPAGAAPAQTT